MFFGTVSYYGSTKSVAYSKSNNKETPSYTPPLYACITQVAYTLKDLSHLSIPLKLALSIIFEYETIEI
jgi:hypothetical protein